MIKSRRSGVSMLCLLSLALVCMACASPTTPPQPASPAGPSLTEPPTLPPAAPAAGATTTAPPALPTEVAAATVPPTTEAPTATTVEVCTGAEAAWIGSFGHGLNCLDSGGWHLYTEDDSPISDQIADVALCPDGRAWIVHSYHLSVTDGRSWDSFRNVWGYGSPEGIACDGGAGVWVAHYEGLSHFDGRDWTTYEAELLGTGQNVKLVKDVAVSPDGRVWAITANSVATWDGETWTVYETGAGFDKDYYFEQVAVDSQGRVWAGHGSGIWYFDGTGWVAHEGPHLSQVQSLLVDAQDRLWAGTYAKGVSVYDGQSWITYTRENGGLSSDHVRALAVDTRGRIWLGTEWGLDVLAGQDWSAYHMHTSGLADNDIYALAIGGGGPDLPSLVSKAPGMLSGSLLRGAEPIAGATVEACAEFIGGLFSGPSPCAGMAFSATAITDADGAFRFELPVGRYGLAFQTGEGDWVRLTGAFGIGDKKVPVAESQETDLGALDVSQ